MTQEDIKAELTENAEHWAKATQKPKEKVKYNFTDKEQTRFPAPNSHNAQGITSPEQSCEPAPFNNA